MTEKRTTKRLNAFVNNGGWQRVVLASSYAELEADYAAQSLELGRIKTEREAFSEVSDEAVKEMVELRKELQAVREALEEARAFVDHHSEPWYKTGQALLAKIDAALKGAST